MIEAVNTSIANAATVRASVEAISASRAAADVAPAPAAELSAPVLPQAPYVSPYIHVDLNYNKAVLQIRNSDTGDVVQQFPTESRLAEIRKVAESLQQRALLSKSQNQPVEAAAEAPKVVERSEISAPKVAVNADVLAVQETGGAQPVQQTAPTNTSIAAFSAAPQSAKAPSKANVSVLA